MSVFQVRDFILFFASKWQQRHAPLHTGEQMLSEA